MLTKKYTFIFITLLFSSIFYANNDSLDTFGFDSISDVDCTFSVKPDLPLIPSTRAIEEEINSILLKYSDDYLGKKQPSKNKLSSAISKYKELNIKIKAGEISGKVLNKLSQYKFLKIFAQHLKFNPKDLKIKVMVNQIVWLVSKQICKGDINFDKRGYEYRHFGRPIIFLQDFLSPQIKKLFEYTFYKTTNNFKDFWVTDFDEAYQEKNDAISTDMMYTKGDIFLGYVAWQNTPEERYRYMLSYKRYMNRFCSPTFGTTNGIKKDGSGFHHWTAYNNYMYAYNTAIKNISYLSKSQFQIDKPNYKAFRDAVLLQFLQANNNGQQALGVCGRKPMQREVTTSSKNLKLLAKIGGEILGVNKADSIISNLHKSIRVDDKKKIKENLHYQGFIQANYANLGVFRKDNFVAVAKGFTNSLWGAEIYPKNNRYGRYQSYGALEILYPGDLAENGYDVETWNWNFNPGTTVIHLPWGKLHAEKKRVDELQIKNFAGSLVFGQKNKDFLSRTFGTYGMFAMDFKEKEGLGFGTEYASNNHNTSFTFKKSTYFFNDFIICLGSNISNNDKENKTITTLFQRMENDVSPIVNGKENSKIGKKIVSGEKNNWIINNKNTGFYILEGNANLVFKKEKQQTPNQNQLWPVKVENNKKDIYYTGYLDHGTNPENKNYEYIIKPNATIEEMKILNNDVVKGKKPYVVHQQNSNAHIVQHIKKNIFAYAIFDSINDTNKGVLKDVDSPCLIMVKNNNDKMLFSISNPDLGLKSRKYTASIAKTANITFKGKWNFSQNNKQVSLISSNQNETTIEVILKDGLPVEINFSKIK